ncbi:MAG: hypothetical protein HYX69_05195 [Planctomycetia bacterium]|nr:hypothetical protein [Planctomycetia bacterium]
MSDAAERCLKLDRGESVARGARLGGSRALPGFAPACLALLLLGTMAARGAEPAGDDLRLNQLQVIGTHNSYHVRPSEKTLRSSATLRPDAREWDYSHAPLDVQLDRGVRSFELDLHYKEGSFEVFHVPVLDDGTTCRKLADALATIRAWSDKHGRHVPISVLFELKTEGPRLDKRIREVDAAGLDALDELIRSVFPAERLITPDLVRGNASTLREAVTTTGWPALSDCRGRVFFVLHDEGRRRDTYTENHPSLKGRAMFVRSDEQRDDGAVMILDNPRSPDIPRVVGAGYMVRTRADSGLKPDQPGRPSRRDAALASGAHIVSTDFPPGEPHAETGYAVAFPDAAAARVNPVSGPENLRGQRVAE